MSKKLNRVLHVTLPKAGSQWVRDVMSAPEVVALSGFPHSRINPTFSESSQLALPNQTLSGPIYHMNFEEWLFFKRPGDKAIVVLRDPRDIIISLMFSIMYSHGSIPQVDLLRRLLHSLPDESNRIMHLIYQSGLGSNHRFYRTWLANNDEDALVIKYEDLINNQHEEFGKIFDWLKWGVSQQILNQVIERLSFESRSGRKPGMTDKFSHYRQGIAGDWRNYFTQEHGQIWEALYPGFLCEIGYEQDKDWWKSLPDKSSGQKYINGQAQNNLDENLISILERNLNKAYKELEAKEQVIQDLSQVKNISRLASNKSILKMFFAKCLVKLNEIKRF